MKGPRAEDEAITPATLARIRHPAVRDEAARALEHGEPVRLVSGRAGGAAGVQTVVIGASARAAQSAGEGVTRGQWNGERLVTDDGDHAFDPDGNCFCRACETAAGQCGDDDE